MSNVLFVAVIGANGIEMPVPRAWCEFERVALPMQRAAYCNKTDLTFSNVFGTAASLGLSRRPSGPLLLTFPLDSPVAVGNAALFRIAPGGIGIESTIAQAIWAGYDSASPTYEEWIKDKTNIPLVPQEIWEAGFLAGSQFTRTLLTGEPND